MAKQSFNARAKPYLTALLLVAMLANLLLAVYIQLQKEHNLELIPPELRGKCFEDAEGGAGCGAVQTSEYAVTFGVSNPHIGYVGFTSLALLLATLLYALSRQPHWVPGLSVVILGGMILGSVFSLWLLYAQFFKILETCIYCLAVDAIMLVSTGLFAWTSCKDINLKRL